MVGEKGAVRVVLGRWRSAARGGLLAVMLALAGTAAEARPARMAEWPQLVGFAVSPIHPRVNQVIRFTFVIRNARQGSLFPGSPPPGTRYTQGESYRSKRGPGARGSYRVAVGWRGPGGRGFPFRWGLAQSIYGGQTKTVTVQARMRRSGTYHFMGRLERVGHGFVSTVKSARVEVRRR